jgi:hypothetical protein
VVVPDFVIEEVVEHEATPFRPSAESVLAANPTPFGRDAQGKMAAHDVQLCASMRHEVRPWQEGGESCADHSSNGVYGSSCLGTVGAVDFRAPVLPPGAP